MNASLIGWPKEEELGEYMYIYTGGDPLVRKEYLIKEVDLWYFLLLYQCKLRIITSEKFYDPLIDLGAYFVWYYQF